MDYQFVVQFEDEGGETLEELETLEDYLIDLLDGIAEVDGHDIGSGSANLFILTGDPKKTFEKIEPALEKAAERGLNPMAVAFRLADADEYTVLWPADFEGEFEVT